MIVCQCAGVSDRMIRQMVCDGAVTVAEIGRRSGAGLCCGPCRREIASLITSSMSAHSRTEVGPEIAACEP